MQTWSFIQNDKTWTGVGQQAFLAQTMTAFFSSRQCTGKAIRASMDWAILQAKVQKTIVSGFHSPLEQSVLKVLLEAQCPVVAVLARPVQSSRLPKTWICALEKGRMAVVSPTTKDVRLNQKLANQRNIWVATLASEIVVGHINPTGELANLCEAWASSNRSLIRLD